MLREQGGNIYLACVELSRVADYLGIDDLIEEISAYVRDSYGPVVEVLQKDWHQQREASQRVWPPRLEASHLPAEFRQKFVEGAEIVFGDDHPKLKPLREAFVAFVADTQYLVLKDDRFLQALSNLTEFKAAIFQNLFVHGSPFYELTNISLPKSCGQCQNRDPICTETWINRLGRIDGHCPDCHGRDRVGDHGRHCE
jgi:hypothetical protein